MGFNTWNLYGCGVTGQVLMDTVITSGNGVGLYSMVTFDGPACLAGPIHARLWTSSSRVSVCQ